jgi:hypothetical protein
MNDAMCDRPMMRCGPYRLFASRFYWTRPAASRWSSSLSRAKSSKVRLPKCPHSRQCKSRKRKCTFDSFDSCVIVFMRNRPAAVSLFSLASGLRDMVGSADSDGEVFGEEEDEDFEELGGAGKDEEEEEVEDAAMQIKTSSKKKGKQQEAAPEVQRSRISRASKAQASSRISKQLSDENDVNRSSKAKVPLDSEDEEEEEEEINPIRDELVGGI